MLDPRCAVGRSIDTVVFDGRTPYILPMQKTVSTNEKAVAYEITKSSCLGSLNLGIDYCVETI